LLSIPVLHPPVRRVQYDVDPILVLTALCRSSIRPEG
jgi:hypothetical protein